MGSGVGRNSSSTRSPSPVTVDMLNCSGRFCARSSSLAPVSREMAARSCVGLSCCFPSEESDLTSSWSGATEENRSRKHHDDGGASVESDQPLPRRVNLL